MGQAAVGGPSDVSLMCCGYVNGGISVSSCDDPYLVDGLIML